MALTDSVTASWHAPLLLTATTDSVAADSVPVTYALVLERPPVEKADLRSGYFTGTEGTTPGWESWILGGLLVMFVIICFRYRKNTRYFTAMLSDLTDVRERHNIFDETVRETSFLILLNVMWSLCSGVILYYLILQGASLFPGLFLRAPQAMTCMPAVSTAICMGIMVVFSAGMALAYSVVGNVFSESAKASLWVKGFASAQGLDCIVMFPVALLLLTNPDWGPGLLLAAAIGYGITKIIFIYKGFRIFFSHSTSWVLFLYYLCSLEIIPLILTYLAAWQICNLL